MMLLVQVDGIETAILGYGPGKGGEPMAIVPWTNGDGDGYCLRPVKLSDCKLINLPEKLHRRLRKQEKAIEAARRGRIPEIPADYFDKR